MAAAPSSVAPLAARALRLVGLVLVLSVLVDYVASLVGANWSEPRWYVATSSQWIDRGVVPLVGLTLWFSGDWLAQQLDPLAITQQKLVRAIARILPLVLSVIFILAVPIHLSNAFTSQAQRLEEVQQQAQQQQQALDLQFQAAIAQQKQQLKQLFGTPGLFEQVKASGQIPPDQVADFEKLVGKPEADIDRFVDQRAAEAKQKQEAELKANQDKQTSAIRREVTANTVRTSLLGLLLVIGYGGISWGILRQNPANV
ncbi:HpsJ family protein [Synechococcus elongatus]|uniref:HpsJ family protein n=1 Tax=Synechococcus elongatus PCC 11802 TaxID=2283154 RepID=A0AAT9K0N3_SYNEL|nr:HpsJ family protein [Synechococcus elongatus]QFZ91695.1 hypothetical protein EKO22_04245 [Synechococcus elongatus PCC 11802]